MWWYRVIIVSALSQRKRVKRERELDKNLFLKPNILIISFDIQSAL